MHTPPRILVVDDQPQNVQILKDRLEGEDYEILTATTGEAALEMATRQEPDLILLDVIMPGMDGNEVCRRLKANVALPFMPVIMVTAKSGAQDIIIGLEAGADEYLTKPLDQEALMARVKSMLRLKSFHDIARDQATQLEGQAAALERWNETLEHQLRKQMTDLEGMGRFKPFLSPPLAEWVRALGNVEPVQHQRREVAMLGCSLGGLTRFIDRTEPQVVWGLLQDYHASIGPLITEAGGHVESFAGGELRVVFNAPLPCDQPVCHAVQLAIAMRQQLDHLAQTWRSSGYGLDFGIGVAHGAATLGLLELGGQWDYAVMGSVRQLASRLSAEARGGAILVSHSVWVEIKEQMQTHPAGELALNGGTAPVPFYEIKGKRENRS